ncbi:MFS transporter [Alcaligenaceae bacterium 429]|nr:MFS transporter [Alcaligenaceae bacterium 429]
MRNRFGTLLLFGYHMQSSRSTLLDLIRIQGAIVCCFFVVGLSLGALPLYISKDLAASDTIVGVVIGSQFIASLVSRIFVGQLLSTIGVRRCVMTSLIGLSLYGLILGTTNFMSSGTITILIVARLMQGLAVGVLTTGAIMWAIHKLGESSTARVLSMTGISIYGAVACGAPIGILLFTYVGLGGVALCIVILAIASALSLLSVENSQAPTNKKAAGKAVLAKVALPGSILFLHGVGFVSIEAFISLYFSVSGWSAVTLALSLFGISFVVVRLVVGHLLQGQHLARLVMMSLSVQAIGLVSLAFAPTQYLALLCVAVIGGSCSLTFPALGAIAAGRCAVHERGTAMGFYSGFQDASYAVTAPVIGMAIHQFGYSTGFILAGACALLGLLLLSKIHR